MNLPISSNSREALARKPKISYLVKLLCLLIGLVVVIEALSFIATRLVIEKAVNKNARAELVAGGELFSRIMQKNVEQLALSVKVLTEDFGFKEAVTSGDEKTIRSALSNHGARVKADLGVFISRQGRILSSDEDMELQINNQFQQLEQSAELHGKAYGTVILSGRAYQFVVFAVKAPLVVGWAGMGFEIKKALSDDLKRLTGLEVSFVDANETGARYLTGTLSESARADLLHNIQQWPAQEEIKAYQGLISLRVPVAGREDKLVAVLQVPLEEVLAPFAQLNVQLLILAIIFALFAALLAWLLARSVTSPVIALAEIAKRIARGSYNTPIAVNSQDEIGELASAFISMQQAIGEREQQVIYQSQHDPLTGLPNRLTIFMRLQQLLAQRPEDSAPLYLVVMDIKNFTQINDELSPEIGDAVLRAAAQRLRNSFNEEQLLRLGSDEFLAWFPLAQGQGVQERMEQIHQLFKSPVSVSGLQLSLEFNLGTAAYPQDADSAESWLRRANLALNRGRVQDRRSCIYQHGWDEDHLRRLHLFREFETALATGQIQVYYQPKINLKEARKLGAEALVRWIHPQMGFISPDEFISVIESSGQIVLLTRWVINQALLQLQHFERKAIVLKMSVNLSALDLLVDELPDYIAGLLANYQIDPQLLCLEVTESAIMREAEKSLNNLNRLRALGVVLSIDDFGTGYSSLSQLKKLPVAELKIDKSFILNLDTNADDQLIVRSTIELGHTLGLSVTAEGVESMAIKQRLQDYGCDTAQGYLYSKPLPAAQFVDWIERHLARQVSPE